MGPELRSAGKALLRPSVPFQPRLATGAAVLSGLAYFLAYPGVDLWPLAFVAVVPLMVALDGQAPRMGAWLGLCAGFTMTITGFYWLLEMLQTFSGFGLPLCLLFMVLLCAYQGGRFALLGFLSTRLQRQGWPLSLGFALGFAVSELVFPLLFPWYFAGAVYQLPALTQVAELSGPIGVSMTLVCANLALAEPLRAFLRGRSPSYGYMGALAAVPLLSAAYGAFRIPAIEAQVAAAPPLRAGLVQADMSLFGKRQDFEQGLARHLDLTEKLEREAGPLDLVVWSETSVMQALDEAKLALDKEPLVPGIRVDVPLVFGAVLLRETADERGYVLFNSALIADAEGVVRGRYDKQYLLPFGEFLPLGETFPNLYRISPNSGRYARGRETGALSLGDYKLLALICYEDILPGYVNGLMQKTDAHLLVNLTNDAWFGDTTEPRIHLALATLRAVEQRRYLIRSTNSGISAFVDPVGRVVAQTKTFRTAALADTVRPLGIRTIYRTLGDSPWYLATAVCVLLCFIKTKRGKRPGRPSVV